MTTEGKLLESFISNHTLEALALIEQQPDELVVVLLSQLPSGVTSRLLVQMDGFKAVRVLESMDPQLRAVLIEEVPVNTTSSMLRLVEEERRDNLLTGVSPDTAREILRLLNFPNHTVGSHLNPVVFTLNQNLSVYECLERIKAHQQPVGNQVPVLDSDHKLVGYTGLKELITANPDKKIRSIMNTDPPSILADTTVSENFIESQSWDEPFNRIPVVDSDGFFLGVVTRAGLTGAKPKKEIFNRQASQASVALAELYQIGLTSLFRSTRE